MISFEALYERRYRSSVGWFEIGEMSLISPDLILEVMAKVRLIRESMKIVQIHRKSGSDVRKRDLEFNVDDWVYLKVSLMKGIMQFGKKGKLSPRYLGPYKVLERIGKADYKLEMPMELSIVYPLFYVSMLRKCISDPNVIVSSNDMIIEENLTYEEVLVEILD